MKIATSKIDLKATIKQWQSQNKTIAFVPTMGNLHAGHIALVEQAAMLADKVVVSIFVNPTQFDKAADLHAYPRTLQDDQDKLNAVNVDLLFSPAVDQVYSDLNNMCAIQVPESTNILEGASRKGHFSGVATVVAKLFNLVEPDIAIFGQKDFQQVMVVRQLVNDMDFDIDIVVAPTVRESDGLAMSSRNRYLTDKERAIAANLHQSLNKLREKIQSGNQNYKDLQTEIAHTLTMKGFTPDYIEVRRQSDLHAPDTDDTALVIVAAAWLGKARLLDNIAFDRDLS